MVEGWNMTFLSPSVDKTFLVGFEVDKGRLDDPILKSLELRDSMKGGEKAGTKRSKCVRIPPSHKTNNPLLIASLLTSLPQFPSVVVPTSSNLPSTPSPRPPHPPQPQPPSSQPPPNNPTLHGTTLNPTPFPSSSSSLTLTVNRTLP